MGIFFLFSVAIPIGLVVFFTRRYSAPDYSRYDTPKTAPLLADSDVGDQHLGVVAKLADFTSKQVVSTEKSRERMEELFYRDVDARIVPADVDGVPGEWVLAEGADPQARLLYLHGGAFRVGSPRSHRYLTSELSKRCGVAVLAIDYRMMPEHKTIACHEDSQIAYRWILQNGPDGLGAPSSLFVAGDSAGGNLTLSVIAWARDNGLRAADGAIGFAPSTDATLSSPTWRSNLKTDPFLGPSLGRMLGIPKFVLLLGSRLTGGAPPNSPVLSPLFGNLGNLPPTLLQVSRDEMLYGDAQRYTNKALEQGREIELQVWPKMVHVFQAFSELPEAQVALDNVAAFVKSRLSFIQADDQPLADARTV